MSQATIEHMASVMESYTPEQAEQAAQERLDRCQIQLLSGSPFFAVLLMKLKKVVSCEAGFTMGVDGKHLYWGPAFVLTLESAELTYVLCHEVLHCALGHHTRRNGRNQGIWNEACDHAINLMLNDMRDVRMRMPKAGLADVQYKGMAAETIYDKLAKDASPESGPGQPGQPGQTGQPVEGHGTGDCGELMDAPVGDASAGERVWQQHANVALNASRKAGKLPGEIGRLIENRAKPQVSWRSVLSQYFSAKAYDDFSFTPPNRRFVHQNIYLPSRRSERLGGIAIVWDTSGSVSRQLMTHYLGESQDIIESCSPTELTLMSCDSRVQDLVRFQEGERWELPDRMGGGGGTRFEPPFRRLEEEGIEPTVLLYFTDMEGSFHFQPPEYDAIWCHVGQGRAPARPPFGIVVDVQEQALAA